MKILIPLLALFSLQSSIAQTRYVTLGNGESVQLKPTDIVEIVGVGRRANSSINFTRSNNRPGFQVGFNSGNNVQNENQSWAKNKDVYTGLTLASVLEGSGVIFTLKITPFVATNITTSKPIIVPPTSANDSKWNVQLQVSTDLSNWEDVVPGEFLGSDKARFFRVKTKTGSDE
ncbi:MAG: hypothetical protein P8Q54_05310 [Akkermansiaceae bacterium]|nr:hypothetical protein [Akkermansiaceae bacterium]